MRKHFLHIIFLLIGFACMAQREWLNPSFSLPSINPAFAMSSYSFNKLDAYYNSQNYSSLQGQYSFNSIYTAVGGEINFKSSQDYSFGARAAYHTFLTRNNYHLLLGAQPNWIKTEHSFGVSPNVGLVLASSSHGKWFVGASHSWAPSLKTTEDNILNHADITRLQIARSLFRITRKMNTSLLGLVELNDRRNGGAVYRSSTTFLNFNFNRNKMVSAGWHNSAEQNNMILRVIWHRKISFAAAFSHAFSSQTTPPNTFEFSIQYAFKSK
jgi:hypothetical protein